MQYANISRCDTLFSIMIGIPLVRRAPIQCLSRPHNLVARRFVRTPTIDWKPVTSKTINLKTAEHHAKMPILRRFFLGLMVAMPVISFFLGCWQVKRLNWKANLIAKSENALVQPPIEQLPAILDPSVIPEFEYRRFKAKGHFDYDQEMFLGPRIRDGVAGYLVVCPFVRLDGGKPILIERGWIHKDKVIPSTRNNKDNYLKHMAMPQGEIEIEALFRMMPKKLNLQFEHEQGTRLFYVPDVDSMAEQLGSLPIYCQMIYDLKDKPWSGPLGTPKAGWKFWEKNQVDEYRPEEYQEFEFVNQGVPIAATPKVKFSNNHMQYLVTWFGLSFFSTGLLIWNLRRFRGGGAEKALEAKRQNMRDNW